MSSSYHSGAGRLAPLSVLLLLIMSAFALIGSSGEVMAITVSEGEISGDVTWTITDSPVAIEGNLTIVSGASLTISPGVIVTLEDDKWIEVIGNMSAIGTDTLPVRFSGSGPGGFDRINVTGGGIGILDHCQITSNEGAGAIGTGSTLRIYNSTLTSPRGVFANSGSEVWAINCSLSASSNVSVSGGTLHEGNWFNFRAVKDTDGTPYEGAELKISATKPQVGDWDVFDSKSGDPTTGSDGRLPSIPVEQYLHAGSRSTARIKFTLKMTADNNRWSESVTDPPLFMGADMDFLWEMDFTPPVTPTNLNVTSKGANYINIEWDFDGNNSEVKFFIIEHKKWWESETDWDSEEPGPSSRDWNISSEVPNNPDGGLLEEMEYDIKLSCIDGSNNPSGVIGPIRVKTLDMTPPEMPVDVIVVDKGGDWLLIAWNRSSSTDVTGYEFYLRNGMGPSVLHSTVISTGEVTQTYNITGLTNETEYIMTMRTVDDGEIPNYSDLTEDLKFKTLDVTPPNAPTLEIVFDDPPQFINGSGYYNGTQIALRGSVEGENRSFIDVFVDDELYLNPNPNLPRPATFEGSFFFFMEFEPGEHDIKVRSIDPGNNAGPFSEIVSLTIDLEAPEIGIELPENMIIETDNDESVVLSANATDDIDVHSIMWSITGPTGLQEIFDDPLDRTFPEGNYSVDLVVFDKAGNQDIVSFSILSQIPDDLIPTVTVVEPTTTIDLDHAPEFKVRFSEIVVWSKLDASVTDDPVVDGRIDLLVNVDEKNMTIEYLLKRSLAGGKNYTLSITGIEDLRGNHGLDLEFKFRTIDDDRVDSDNDGIPDVYEVQKTFLSPSDPTDAPEDEDGDGLTNVEEYRAGSDPQIKDSDGDEMTDGWEVANGFFPLDRSDALQDPDGDGYTNLEEFRANTNPHDILDKPTTSSDDTDLTLIIIIVIAVIILVVIAIIVLIVMKRRSEKEEEDKEASEIEQVTTETTWGEQEEAKKGECPSCGATIEDGLDYCPECGTTISIGDEPASGILEDNDVPESIMDEEPTIEEEQIETEDIPAPVEIEDEIQMNEPPSM